jgi:hypothetical protein
MKWLGRRKSSNVDDRRSSNGAKYCRKDVENFHPINMGNPFRLAQFQGIKLIITCQDGSVRSYATESGWSSL